MTSPPESIPSSLLPSGLATPIFLIALLLAALFLIFFGQRVVKVVAFILGGLAGAYFGGILGAAFLGSFGTLVAEVIGFLLGGFLGMSFLSFAIGLGLGYAGYAITQAILGSTPASISVGLMLFFIGMILAGKILSLVSVIFGGFLLLNVLSSVGLPLELALLAIIILSSLGLWVQNESAKRMSLS